MKYLALLLLIIGPFAAFAQSGNDCNMLIHKTIKDEYTKATKKEIIYNIPNKVFGMYIQNRNGFYQVIADWDISPKALDEGQKFNGAKPLMVTFYFKDNTSYTLTFEEYQPGKGATKVRYANYMIGASVFITEEQIAILTKSPIVKISENLYGVVFQETHPLRADYWIRTINCVRPDAK